MANKKELQALIVLAGKVDPSLKSAIASATSQSEKLGKSAKKSASGVSNVGNIIKGVFVGNLLTNAISNISSKMLELGKSGIQLASDLTEVQNVVDVTFGDSSESINKWSKAALNGYGLSELAAKKYTGTMGAMLKSSGLAGESVVKMSEGLTGLSGDLASFYNLSQEDAFEKIQAGISGEVKPLRELGINMTVANLEAYALSKGIKTSYEKMDQASQVALRYSYLMEKTKDAQGDFVRTQGSFANQSRLLTTNLQQLAAKMASGIIPMLTKLAQAANSFLSGSGGKSIEVFFKALLDNASELMPMVQQLLTAITTLGPPITDLIQQIIPMLTQLYSGIMPVLTKLIQILVSILKPLMPIIGMLVEKLIPPIMKILNTLMPLLEALTPVIAFIADLIGFQLANAIQMLMPLINLVSNQIGVWLKVFTELINFITNVFTGNWEGAWKNITNIFSTVWQGMGDTVKGLLNFIIGGINGVIRGANKMSGIIGKVIGKDIKIPEIPTFARGGFANRPSIFGEAGLEAAIPIKYKNPRSLSLLSQTAKAIGADTKESSGVTLVYSPNIYGGNSSEISSALREDFERFKEWAESYFEGKARESFE